MIVKEMVHDRFSHLKSPLWLDSDVSADETSPRLRESLSNGDFSQGQLTEGDSPQDEDKSRGVQRSSGVKSDKEKKKRTRVTPEQLVHLERYFAMDRNPTAARRKDISELLGMQERQTQIWFQNRSVSRLLHVSIFDPDHMVVVQRPSFKMENTILNSWILDLTLLCRRHSLQNFRTSYTKMAVSPDIFWEDIHLSGFYCSGDRNPVYRPFHWYMASHRKFRNRV